MVFSASLLDDNRVISHIVNEIICVISVTRILRTQISLISQIVTICVHLCHYD